MTYGLQTFDKKGNILFDSNQRTLKLHGIKEVQSFGSLSINLPKGQHPFAMLLPKHTIYSGAILYLAARDNGTITWHISGGHNIENYRYDLYYGSY